MEVVAYVRVSSKAQDYKSQRAAIERAADARGDQVVRWYSEKLSGRTVARPELDRLRQAARSGEVRRMYVYRLDRLTRAPNGLKPAVKLLHSRLAPSCVVCIDIFDGGDPTGENEVRVQVRRDVLLVSGEALALGLRPCRMSGSSIDTRRPSATPWRSRTRRSSERRGRAA